MTNADVRPPTVSHLIVAGSPEGCSKQHSYIGDFEKRRNYQFERVRAFPLAFPLYKLFVINNR